MITSDPIGDFLNAVEAAAIHDTDVYAEDAVLDATVPNWRFRAVGPEAIKAEYGQWFSEPATFAALERIPVPDGDLVIYEHEWVQDGVHHRGHGAVEVPGPATEAVGTAAAEASVYLAIGVNERDGGTVYNTLLFFAPDGSLLGKHRKLMPTGAERLVSGQGDGSGLVTFETPFGRLGGLVCWENYMPLARAARTPSASTSTSSRPGTTATCGCRRSATSPKGGRSTSPGSPTACGDPTSPATCPGRDLRR